MHLFLSHLHPHTCIHFNLVWGSFPRVDTNIIPLSWTAIFPLDSRRCPVPLPSTFWQNFSLSWRKLLLSVVTKSFFPSPAYGLACSLAYSSLCPLIKFCEQRPSDDHKMPEPQCHALKERVPQGLWDLYNDWAEWSQAFSWQTLNTCYTIHKMVKSKLSCVNCSDFDDKIFLCDTHATPAQEYTVTYKLSQPWWSNCNCSSRQKRGAT